MKITQSLIKKVLQYISLIIQISDMLSKKLLQKMNNRTAPKLSSFSMKWQGSDRYLRKAWRFNCLSLNLHSLLRHTLRRPQDSIMLEEDPWRVRYLILYGHRQICDAVQPEIGVWATRQQELPLEDKQCLKRSVEFLREGNALYFVAPYLLYWKLSQIGHRNWLNVPCHRR